MRQVRGVQRIGILGTHPLAFAPALFVQTLIVFSTLALAIIFAILATFAISQTAYAEESDHVTSRAIGIGYDNSGSMAQGTDKWCNAQYSLEVLAAMMDSRDILSLYAMDNPGEKLHITGSTDAAARASTVHNADLGVSDWTDPRAAREAYEWLLAQQTDEKYLVITTDGNFNVGGRLDDVRQTVNDAVSSGMSVIYLAIGDQAEQIAPDEKSHIYVMRAASGNDILSTMTATANLIFGRAPLDSSMFDQGGNLTLEVPMGQLIVLAQGANVQVGALEAGGRTFDPSVAAVRYRDRMTDGPTEYGGDNPNTNLQGVVATFDGDIPKGSAKLSVSGAEDLQIYYKPNIDIAIGLKDATGFSYRLEPGSTNKLTEGTYAVSYEFLDPDTGETLESSLLYPADFTLTIDNANQMKTVREGDTVDLQRGAAVASATATTPGGGKAHQQYPNIKVIPPAVPLTISTIERPRQLDQGESSTDSNADTQNSGPLPFNLPFKLPEIPFLSGGPLSPDTLDVHHLENTTPFKIHVTKQGGEELDDDEWAATELTAQTDRITSLFSGEQWIETQVSKTREPGIFEVKINPATDLMHTRGGDVPIELQAITDMDDVQYRGADTETAHITVQSFIDLFLYLLPLIIAVTLFVAFVLWLLGAARINRRFWNDTVLDGAVVPLTCLGSKPRRIGGSVAGLISNKWEWVGAMNAPKNVPIPASRSIILHGKYFKFGKEVTFENFDEWAAKGWHFTKNKTTRRRIRRGAQMSCRGYTITFGK